MDSQCGKNVTRDLHVEKNSDKTKVMTKRREKFCCCDDDATLAIKTGRKWMVNMSGGEKFLEQKPDCRKV